MFKNIYQHRAKTMYLDSNQILNWVKGNKSAADFLESILGIAHIWDDLIDKDKEVSNHDINKAFFEALIRLPRNTFYNKNFDHLNSVLINSISNWQIATKLERTGKEYETSIAFILRSSYVDLITQSALLIGGEVWACHVGEEIRRLTHHETYQGYLKSLALEKEAREANTGIPDEVPQPH